MGGVGAGLARISLELDLRLVVMDMPTVLLEEQVKTTLVAARHENHMKQSSEGIQL